MSKVELMLGDCLELMKTLPDGSVDSIVTDPPYGLSFMGKRWDYDVPGVAVWRECLRVLKPGGHLLSFGGPRTYHRLAVNVEDAGFEIRDQIMWLYGSGFPKSHDVSKGIDKAAGAEREKVRVAPRASTSGTMAGSTDTRPWIEKSREVGYHEVAGNTPATDAARQWQGWGTALKPAHEPIVMARKPIVGTVAANVLEHGTGAINVDGCRVGEDGGTRKSNPAKRGSVSAYGNGLNGGGCEAIDAGRWPANVIHDGSDEVVAGFPNDNARFFYCAKASKKDRGQGNTHPTVKPTDLIAYLCRLVTPPGGVVLDPFMGSGSTGKAALREGFNFKGMEMDQGYFEIASRRIKGAQDAIQKDVSG